MKEVSIVKQLKILDRKSKKTREFILKSQSIHGDKYIYDLVVYDNCRTKVKIVCPTHGVFDQTPDGHKSYGCEQCSRDDHRVTEVSLDRLGNLKLIHNNKYLYDNLSVDNGKIKIICPLHGEFIQSIYNHEYGHGCYKCEKESRKKIRTKVCNSCKIDKNKSDFLPKYRICKDCCENKIIPDFKFCNKCGVETPINEFPIRKDSPDNHRNECIVCHKFEQKIRSKLYKKKNRKSLQEKDMKYRKERMKNDPFYRAKIDARNIVRKALREKGYTKSSKTEQILGCSFIDFKNHIESLFLPNMNWENRDEWHIDHTVPLDFAIDEGEILELNHYMNLRPLWIKDNLEKSDTITEKTDIYYRILNQRN